ncbi:aminotransferase [Drancourtella sp. An210]|nr:MalY/PatB family protein [uncultured Sellimonas sp.]OUP00524.1 aminotransferase [Drancourtella sp. An210]
MQRIIYKERKNTNCTKWDSCGEKFGSTDLLPVWVADMDFEVPSCVKEAIKEYADFGVFGYYKPEKGYYDALIRWEETYHNYTVDKEWIRFAPGVVPAINWLMHILTREKDGVIIMPPVYYPFRDAIVNNDRQVVESPLVRTEHGYVINYGDFERKIKENNVKLFIFCSPHNPVGRVWNEEEIRKVLDICKKYNVYVIADEIHQDIIMKGYHQVAAATTGAYDDILITLTAATKTFNLAACKNSILVIPDDRLRKKYDHYLERLRINGGNAFGYIAVQSAYENGREWLEEVLEIIESNYQYLRKTLQEALPDVWISNLEGTYLMWIDLGNYIKPEEMEHVIQDVCGLAVDYGTWFGGDEYAGFVRVNLATCRENIESVAQRIICALKK